MQNDTIATILRLAEQLTDKERELLARQLRLHRSKSAPRRRWSEIAGTAPYPLAGEDAQAWVSRSREEADIERTL